MKWSKFMYTSSRILSITVFIILLSMESTISAYNFPPEL